MLAQHRVTKTSQLWQAVVSASMDWFWQLVMSKQHQHTFRNYMHIQLALSLHFCWLYLLIFWDTVYKLTSTKMIRDSKLDFWIKDTGVLSGSLLDQSQNVSDSLPCPISWKLASYCTRNADKSPRMPDSAVLRKWKSEWECRTGSSTKVNQFFWLVGPITTPSFN